MLYGRVTVSFALCMFSVFSMEDNNEIWWQNAKASLQRNVRQLRRYQKDTVCNQPEQYSQVHYVCWHLSENALWLVQRAQKHPEDKAAQRDANYARQQYRTHFGEEFQE